jgi:hypothetical protein
MAVKATIAGLAPQASATSVLGLEPQKGSADAAQRADQNRERFEPDAQSTSLTLWLSGARIRLRLKFSRPDSRSSELL